MVRITYAALAEWVGSLTTPAKPILIGVDGPAGSGKSSFAHNLWAVIPASAIVPLDDFMSWDHLDEWWPRFENQVLQQLREGREVGYQQRDWESDPLGSSLGGWRTIEPARIVIIEGVTACRKALAKDLTTRIWVEAPADIRMARGIQRDGPQMKERWLDWLRREQEFFDNDETKSRCDLLVDGNASESPSSFNAADGPLSRRLAL